MLVQILDKQRRGVSVVKAALLGVGISGRSVCVQSDRWAYSHGHNSDRYSVFVSAPDGTNIEPFFVTGETLVEAVRNMIDSIKGRKNDAATEVSEVAPF